MLSLKTTKKDQLKRLSNDNFIVPVSSKLIAEIIAKKLIERSKEISKLPI